MVAMVVIVYLPPWPLAEGTAVDPLTGQCRVLCDAAKLTVLAVVGIYAHTHTTAVGHSVCHTYVCVVLCPTIEVSSEWSEVVSPRTQVLLLGLELYRPHV